MVAKIIRSDCCATNKIVDIKLKFSVLSLHTHSFSLTYAFLLFSGKSQYFLNGNDWIARYVRRYNTQLSYTVFYMIKSLKSVEFWEGTYKFNLFLFNFLSTLTSLSKCAVNTDLSVMEFVYGTHIYD